eukprot:171392_1
MATGDLSTDSHTSTSVLSLSSISYPEHTSARHHDSLIDPIQQTLYSTAKRYEQTNKQTLLKRLESSIKSRRYKLFYGILCIFILVLSYQCILYLMSDLSTNYNYKQPLFIHYISYSIFPFLIGLPLVHPLWIVANKYHKSTAKQRIIIGSTSDNTDTDKHAQQTKHTNGVALSAYPSHHHSEVQSASYLSDDYEEYDDDHSASLLGLNEDHELSAKKESVTELGMLSELSFNDIGRHNTHNRHHNRITLPRNALLFPFASNKSKQNSKARPKERTLHEDVGMIYGEAKSECDVGGFNVSMKQMNSLPHKKNIIVASKRDISHIPQSVYFTLDLPFRSFRFYFRKIGVFVFSILFVIHAIGSVLWMLSIQNAIDIHEEAFYVENSIHCVRVVVSFALCIACVKHMRSRVNYRNILCLLMLVFGLIAILFHNWDVFDAYHVHQFVILAFAPIFNGILAQYIEYISCEYLYKKSFAMFVADILFILGCNALMNLMILWVVLVVAHYTEYELWPGIPTDVDIIWRLCVIAALWGVYNIALFAGITLLNCVVIGFGFALIIPCNVLLDSNLNQIFDIENGQELSMVIGVCLICLAFIVHETQFYVLYIMYCGGCRKCCGKSRTSCIRSMHKKTRYRCYGQCCRICRCC